MTRERVIVEIESLGQALKIEQTIRTGYCDPIAESILQWIAVEEDLANSYRKIASKSDNLDLRKALAELEQESREAENILHTMLKNVEELKEARLRREKRVESLND